jgi:hypothetical protein
MRWWSLSSEADALASQSVKVAGRGVPPACSIRRQPIRDQIARVHLG